MGNKTEMRAYLLGGPVALSDVFAVLQPLQDLLDRGLLFSRLLLLKTLTTLAGLLLLQLESLLHKLDILQSQLLGNDIQITSGVDVSLNVDDLSIVKASDDLENRIDGTDV